MTETLLWEAWEDYNAVTGCKTIYVLGEMEMQGERLTPVLRKKELPGLSPTNLVLEIVSGTNKTRKQVEELIYTEEICDQKFYDMITVFLGNKVIAEITELEKIAIA
ncbi:MAG: hypothetical protein C4329_01330 [Chitinophagaceae bacterium]